jgi:hypothetical protein
MQTYTDAQMETALQRHLTNGGTAITTSGIQCVEAVSLAVEGCFELLIEPPPCTASVLRGVHTAQQQRRTSSGSSSEQTRLCTSLPL